ncbi:MAG: hypothetical protein C0483_22070 [Pirellula sp.]|nr:hypothetical protein [Pirellula sp.]
MNGDPSKTTHEDVGLTSLNKSFSELPPPRAQAAGTGDDAQLEFAAPAAKGGTKRRIAAAAVILAILAGEAAWAYSRAQSPADGRATLAALPAGDKAALAAKYERYQKLPKSERDRVRALAIEFADSGDEAGLLATMRDYLRWKSKLVPQQSAMFVGLDAAARLQRVQTIVSEQQAASAQVFSDADSKVVMGWLEAQVRAHQDKLLENLPAIVRERFEAMGSRERTWALMYYVISQKGGPGPSRFDVVGTQALAELRSKLSPQAQARWAAAEKERDGDDPKTLLSEWIRISIERSVGYRGEGAATMARIDDNDLRKFFEKELSEGERQRLLALSPADMQSQLRREYLRSRGLWKEPAAGRFGPFPRTFGSGDPRSGPPSFRNQPDGKMPDGRFPDGKFPGNGGGSGFKPQPGGRGPDDRKQPAPPPPGKPKPVEPTVS